MFLLLFCLKARVDLQLMHLRYACNMSDAGWGPPNPAKHGHTEPVVPGGKSSNEATFYRFFWGWIEATAAEAVGLLLFRGFVFILKLRLTLS